VALAFQPGETFQFDWSEDYAVLGGKPVKLQVAHTKLRKRKTIPINPRQAACSMNSLWVIRLTVTTIISASA